MPSLLAELRPEENEDEFVIVFSQRSYPHLLSVSAKYQENYGTSLRAVIDAEFTGAFRDTLWAIRNYYHHLIFIIRNVKICHINF